MANTALLAFTRIQYDLRIVNSVGLKTPLTYSRIDMVLVELYQRGWNLVSVSANRTTAIDLVFEQTGQKVLEDSRNWAIMIRRGNNADVHFGDIGIMQDKPVDECIRTIEAKGMEFVSITSCADGKYYSVSLWRAPETTKEDSQ